jgi:hypothetical protein
MRICLRVRARMRACVHFGVRIVAWERKTLLNTKTHWTLALTPYEEYERMPAYSMDNIRF